MEKKERLLTLELGEFDLSPGSALLSKLLFLWNSVSIFAAVVIVILTTKVAVITITTALFLTYARYCTVFKDLSHPFSHWSLNVHAW